MSGQNAGTVAVVSRERVIDTPDKITKIQLMLVRGEQVPLAMHPDLPAADRNALAIVGVETIKKLIFCSNTRLTRAFGGNGASGTKRRVRRINAALNILGFPRRMSIKQYDRRIKELQRVFAQEY